MHIYDLTHTHTHGPIQTHRYTPVPPAAAVCSKYLEKEIFLKKRLKEMEDLYRLFPSADTQEGEGGESERERGR